MNQVNDLDILKLKSIKHTHIELEGERKRINLFLLVQNDMIKILQCKNN